jgi:DNA gyrase subunit A
MTQFAANVVRTDIEDEMKSSYLDYSMSVIVGRALPVARDGLKPVHRRILYAMFREGLLHNRRYSKCAGVVGEVLKKYHPHGDGAVYDALVRMAQPWNLRYPLVDGQGNFGNIDGDSAAAYRYTECRMERMAEDLLSDIDKETVDFIENYDGTTVEPLVMPTRVPNLLVNGSSGIAVGMATNVPPHNLGEVVDATVALIDEPELTAIDLMEYVPGPDFPTGGVIYGKGGPYEAATTGRGRIIVRGVAEIETDVHGDDKAIAITEIPYQVNKSRLVETIARLVREKKIDGIRDIRDESDRTGMRIYIELKRDAIGQIVLNHLYKHTALQNTFGAINLALVHGRPETLTLKEMLAEFIAHRKEVVLRRTRYELTQAEAREHIISGYLRALDVIDEIITIIRSSPDSETARGKLIERFEFTHVQAQAILDMRLARLTGLERDKLLAEHAGLMARIEELRALLGNEQLVRDLIKEELLEIRGRYADARRTRIIESSADLSIEDLVPDEDVVVTFSHLGYVKRTPLREYRAQGRGGKGRRGMGTRDEDFVRDVFVARTHDKLMTFTSMGRVYLLPVYHVPEGGPAARGRPIVNLVDLDDDETVATVIPIRDFDERSLVMVSRGGMIKRTALTDYRNIRASGIIAIGLKEGDRVLDVKLLESPETDSVLLSTAHGKAIHFKVHSPKETAEGMQDAGVRQMGRVARGVTGIKLVGDDKVVGMTVIPADLEEPEVTEELSRLIEGQALLTVTENGYGKLTPISEYRMQGRGGIGLIDIHTRDRNGPVVAAALIEAFGQIMIVTDGGKVIRTGVDEVRVSSRNTKGVTLIRLAEDEKVVGFARVEEREEDDVSTSGEVPIAEGEGGEGEAATADGAVPVAPADSTPVATGDLSETETLKEVFLARAMEQKLQEESSEEPSDE